MSQDPTFAMRDLSYASAGGNAPSKALIRMMENATGRLSLIKRLRGYERDLGTRANFFDMMVVRCGLQLDVTRGHLGLIPQSGPVIFIANHPYGILDGLMMGHIMAQTRPDFRILAHSVFSRAPDLNKHLLPIDFSSSKSAIATNISTRKSALAALQTGAAIGVFPGGTVSTAARLFAPPVDPVWRSFTARMIAKSRAQVVPLFFEGHTSLLFQLASRIHPTLRVGLLMREFHNRVDAPVRVAIGAPIGRDVLDPMAADAKAMMDFLRKATYGLSPTPMPSEVLGYEFEQHHRA